MTIETAPGTVVIVGNVQRRRGRCVELVEGAARPAERKRPLRVARTLALAHVLRDLVDSGVVRDQVELAEVTGFTRARITQLLDLTLLAPDIQEAILVAEVDGGRDWVTERALRKVVRELGWVEQRGRWGAA